MKYCIILLFVLGCNKPVECILNPEKATLEISDTNLYFKSITIYTNYKNGEQKTFNLDYSFPNIYKKVYIDSILKHYKTNFKQEINNNLMSMQFHIFIINKTETIIMSKSGTFDYSIENYHRILKINKRS